MTREELIAALEKADGPTFVMDQALADWLWEGSGYPTPLIPKPYTSSLDAALTLVPEPWKVDWIQENLDEPGWQGGVYRRGEKWPIKRRSGAGCNGAIALCIAALKARA